MKTTEHKLRGIPWIQVEDRAVTVHDKHVHIMKFDMIYDLRLPSRFDLRFRTSRK